MSVSPDYYVYTHRRQKESDILELELQMVLSCHVGIGNWTQFLCLKNNFFSYWAVSPIPYHKFKAWKTEQNHIF